MVGKTVGELSPFKDMESNKVMLERLQKDGYVRYEDLPLEARDGRRIAVEFVSNVPGARKLIGGRDPWRLANSSHAFMAFGVTLSAKGTGQMI